MQLLNSLPTQDVCVTSQHILDILQDIIKVQIQSNFCILHPDYKPWELPSEVVARFQAMPAEVQNRYMSLQLRSFIYGIHYNGSMKAVLALDANANSQPVNLENNTVLGVDLGFYDRLHNSNTGGGYFDPGWYVLRQETDGMLAVHKGGLTLHIEREIHLQDAEQSAAIGDTVAIRMPKNFVQNGFYMAVGNAGAESHHHPSQVPQLVRVYFNLTPEGAVAVIANLTQHLNAIAMPFTFKVLYNQGDYNRHDSGVLYFEKHSYEVVREVLQKVYIKNKSYFQSEIPLFTKLLAPGLGLAEEPDSKFATQESFGMNRCQIIANALLEAWNQGDDSPQAKMKAIFQHFSLLQLDWQYAYLNAKSNDIYTPLEL
ncbi:MAG: T3SS effector HopA1 family protein [Nostoc sp. S4]|nr:T3SS effector HopA1 family protein [Nostoc sp. S4]